MKVSAELKLDKELVELLKKNATKEQLSLSKYVESLLKHMINAEPNDTTKASILEAEGGKDLEHITDLEEYKAQLLRDV